MSRITMKTFYGDDGNYEDISLEDILDRMTDDWIDGNITGANISELRDACRKLLETVHNSDHTKCGCGSTTNTDVYCQECLTKFAELIKIAERGN